jgi:hypothetical protein
MRTKHIILVVGALVLAAGLWFGRAAWRAHRQLVTLDVHNARLAEVLRKVEWQTWEKIRSEKNLDARITLHVKDKPLSYVLDRLAEQAGARWSTVYAVYDSRSALNALESALSGNGKLEPAGWTKIAPNPAALNELGAKGAGIFKRSANAGPSGPETGGPSLSVDASPGEVPPPPPPELTGGAPQLMGDISKPESPDPMAGKRGQMMVRRAGNGSMIFQNGNGQVEVWSPEELVLESSLHNRLGSEHGEAATAAAAAETAHKVKGRWTTYFKLHKSAMGMALGGPPPDKPGFDPFKQKPNPNDRFARFTPAQRVQRERERLQRNRK